MGNDKSKFFIFRSPLLWVALGLAIIFIGLSVETAAHDPDTPNRDEIRFTVNLESGAVTGLTSCSNCKESPPRPRGQRESGPEGVVKVWLEFYEGSHCVTIYHNGVPIEVCGP